MVTFEQLLAFRAIVRLRSFTRAAEELFLSQSAISQRVRHLERALGAELFRRDGNRRAISLTAAGEQALEFADEVIIRLERLQQEMRQERGLDQREVVTVACSPAPAKYILPCILTALHELHPRVQVNVLESMGTDINTMVRSGAAELGVQISTLVEGQDSQFRVLPLLADRMVLIAAATHPILAQPREWLSSVRRCPFAVAHPKGYGRRIVRQWASSLGLEIDIVMEANNVEVLKEAVMRGLGLAAVSEIAVAKEVSDGSLVIVPAPGMPHELKFCLIWNAARRLSPAAHAFLEIGRGGAWQTNLPTVSPSSR